MLSKICSIKHNEFGDYIYLKKDLLTLVYRIKKFNLFTLTFSEQFMLCLEKKTIENISEDKFVLITELYFELYECLYTTRLRYGGELMYYIFELKLALLNLSLPELSKFEEAIKKPIHYFFPENFVFKTEYEKKEKVNEIKINQRQSKVIKQKVKIKEKEYEIIETKLHEFYYQYKSYILSNYPAISDLFSFYNKRVRAYVTEAISKNIYEFRFHSYITNTKNPAITLIHEYYDFYPAYFKNLEEISEELCGAMVIVLRKDNLDFPNPFTIKYIHRELVSIFLRNSKEKDVEEFSEFLLKCEGYKFASNTIALKYRFDLYAEKSNKQFLFEIFHHKSRSSVKLLERIKSFNQKITNEKVIFVFSAYPGDAVNKILEQNNIIPIYINDLVDKHFNVDNSQILHWYIQTKISSLKLSQKGSKKFEGETLIKRLNNCPEGDKNWSDYEDIGIDIFRFLFEDSFKSLMYETQIENDLKNHRRYLIVSNYYKDPSSFWAEVKNEYKAKAIIVDFKNYSKKLNSSTLFSVSKYNNKKVGYFTIIFSRKGIDKTAVIEQRTLLSDGKLIIEFNDNELIEMINEKIIGIDPLDRLKSKEFELVKK